jgi:hypothetical protein
MGGGGGQGWRNMEWCGNNQNVASNPSPKEVGMLALSQSAVFSYQWPGFKTWLGLGCFQEVRFLSHFT